MRVGGGDGGNQDTWARVKIKRVGGGEDTINVE